MKFWGFWIWVWAAIAAFGVTALTGSWLWVVIVFGLLVIMGMARANDDN